MADQTLEQFIKGKVTAATFEALPEKLGISQTKFTRIMNRPHEASKDEVLDLAALLKVEASYLVNTFRMGYNNITLDELESFKKIA